MIALPAPSEPDSLSSNAGRAAALPTENHIAGWHQRLLGDGKRLAYLTDQRGLTLGTLGRFEVGWDGSRYTIPVRDADGDAVNVRRYQPNGNPKILGLTGRGSQLMGTYPLDESKPVLVTGGEWDLLAAAQLGYQAVTGTAGEGTFKREWVPALVGAHVVLVLDSDEAGRTAASKVGALLMGTARTVCDVVLPNKDVNEYLLAGGTKRALDALIEATAPLTAAEDEPDTSKGVRLSDTQAKKLVRRAVDEKVHELGSRNQAGFRWVACVLRDQGVSEADAEPVMRAFQQAVEHLKPGEPPYTVEEALRSLRSAYERSPRPGVLPWPYPYTDVGNAEALVHRHGGDMRWVPADKAWAVWDGRRWRTDDDGETLRWAKQTTREAARIARQNGATPGGKDWPDKLYAHARASESTGRLKAALETAQSEPGITRQAEAFDADPALLTCRNGVVVLGQDGVTFREHSRDDYCRRMTGLDYRPKARPGAWAGFLTEVLPDEDVRGYVQQLVGYSLFGGNPARVLPIIIGPTSTGKSTFIEALGGALGEFARTYDLVTFRVKQDEGPRVDILDILSRRLAYATEASPEWNLHADHIKHMTGSDRIKARGMQSNVFTERVPGFTPWIITNAPPTIRNADAALWRRLVAVPFRAEIEPARDRPGFAAELIRAAGEEILAWAVAGWPVYLAQKLAVRPAAVIAATAVLRESLSEVDAWLAERTVAGPDFEVRFAALWDDYCDWAYVNGTTDRDRLTKTALGAQLGARNYPDEKRRQPGTDTKAHWRTGLRLAGGADPASRIRRVS